MLRGFAGHSRPPARQGARQRLRDDLGLYAEEYNVARGRQVGNFPQAFTHLALIEAARVLSGERVGTRSTTPASLPRLPAPPPRPAPVTLRRP
jgi:Glycosyl hydrolases family 15